MRLVLSFLVALSFPVHAQHDQRAHAAHTAPVAQPASLTEGLVKKVDKTAREVVIQHGPLDSIGMPPMTMAFTVADPAWLGKLKAGDRIRFAAEMKGGNPMVSRYELAK